MHAKKSLSTLWWIRGAPLPARKTLPACDFTMLSAAICSAALPQAEFQFHNFPLVSGSGAARARFAGSLGHCHRGHQSTRLCLRAYDKRKERPRPFKTGVMVTVVQINCQRQFPQSIAKMGPDLQGWLSPHFSIPLMPSVRGPSDKGNRRRAKPNKDGLREN
jgi:hypothetical protein